MIIETMEKWEMANGRETDPYWQGWQAYLLNVELGYNPYPTGSSEAYDWKLGWENSQEDYENGLVG